MKAKRWSVRVPVLGCKLGAPGIPPPQVVPVVHVPFECIDRGLLLVKLPERAEIAPQLRLGS